MQRIVFISSYACFFFRCPSKTSSVKCTSGSYSPGMQLNCITCPKGYQCPNEGLIAPLQCPLGQYQDETGQSNCEECAIGQYCPNTTSSGLSCATGLYSIGNASVCLTCPAGYRYADRKCSFYFAWDYSCIYKGES